MLQSAVKFIDFRADVDGNLPEFLEPQTKYVETS